MISTSLCDLDCISSARVDGRLLHVRIDLGNSAIDAVNVYQKVYQTGGTRLEKGQSSTPVEQRTQVWNMLRALLNELPTRHHLVLTGDFNTPAPLVRGLVGTKADMHRTPAVPDLRMLEALVTDFQLLHLNSWVRGAGPTFISPQSSSQIDHIFVRRTHPCLCTYVHVYGHGNECICTCTNTNKPNGTQHVYVHMYLHSLYMYLYIYGVVRYAWYGMVWCGVVWYAVALGCKYCILLYV